MDFDKAYDKLDWVREQLESTVSNSRVELMPSDMGDFFITVTQRNETTGNDNTWSFCVNIDDNNVQMLEPTEDEEQFTNITEVFSIIKSFLQGGISREKRLGNKIDSSKKLIKSSLSDVNKALGFTDKDIEEDGKIHITTDLGEFVVDYVNDEYIVSYDGEERIFTEYKDTVEEVVELFNQLCSEEVKLFNKNINSSKPIKSSAEPTKYDYHFFYNKLKNSPYFEEYVVRYDDDAGEDNIHTKQNIPVTIIFPDGKRTECPSCYVQFYQSGWRFVAEGVMSGKESYSEIKDVTFTSENVIIMDSDGFTFDFLYDNIAIKSSRKPIKSSFTQNELNCLREMIIDGMDERFYDWYSEKYGSEPWNATNEQMAEWIKSDPEITKEYNDYLEREMPYYEPGHDEKYVNEFLKSSRKPIKSSTDYIEEYIASDSFAESGAYEEYIIDKLSQKGFSSEEIEYGWHDDPVKSAREEIEKNYNVDDYINWAKNYIAKDKYKMMWYKDWLLANGYPVEEELLTKQYSFDPANNTWPGPSHQ